jgi:methylmalonyl-CoA/ethylmalonyl-CoA epimerase
MTPESAAQAAGLAAGLFGKTPDQVAFVTDDLEATARRLSDAFGLGPWDGYLYSPDYLPNRIYRGAPGRFVSRTCGCRTAPMVEIVQPIEGPSIFTEFLEKHGPGLQHVAYFVKSLDAVREHMRRLGYDEVQGGGGHGMDGDGKFAFFEIPGPVGLSVEIVEPPKRRFPPHFTLPGPSL